MHAKILFVALAALPVLPRAEAEDPSNFSEFLSAGPPTFVLGTRGDERCDRAVRGQVRFIRELLFATATTLKDTDVDASKGPDGWPARPVLYGGEHVNGLLAEVAEELPFRIGPGRLELAGAVYEGDEYRLLALVPSLPPAEGVLGHPAFLLYAGCATPGIEEINSVRDGGFAWVAADRFGPLVMGSWGRAPEGLRAEVIDRKRRLPWRTEVVAAERGGGVELGLHRLELDPPAPVDAAENSAVARGVARSMRKLGLEEARRLEVYVYPDKGSKRSLTRAGDGHADLPSRSLHVLPYGASEGGPLELLVAHEAVHVLATETLGAPGCALWGEGLAVWVADAYGGKSLAEWERTLPPYDVGVADLQGVMFHRLPEGATYPLAGLYTRALIAEVGFDKYSAHLYPSTAKDFAAACTAAGTTPQRAAELWAGLRKEDSR